MRISALVFGVALFSATLPALAADTEGRITSIDPEKMTITLSDGTTYKLPSEMDASKLESGDEVVIAYHVENSGVKQITDLFVPE